MVKVREHSPDFKLQGVLNEEIKEYSLSDYKGKWVVLYFYPSDFTFICPREVAEFSRRYEEGTLPRNDRIGCCAD